MCNRHRYWFHHYSRNGHHLLHEVLVKQRREVIFGLVTHPDRGHSGELPCQNGPRRIHAVQTTVVSCDHICLFYLSRRKAGINQKINVRICLLSFKALDIKCTDHYPKPVWDV